MTHTVMVELSITQTHPPFIITISITTTTGSDGSNIEEEDGKFRVRGQ